MSLLYIIDGYNIISHTSFTTLKKNKDSRRTLLELIKIDRLCGSPRNRAVVVFDGYPPSPDKDLGQEGARVIFSRRDTADDRIKRIIEAQPNPRNIVVVSDDKEIRFFARAMGSLPMAVEDFIRTDKDRQERGLKRASGRKAEIKPELSYSQMDKINRELKGLWLKN